MKSRITKTGLAQRLVALLAEADERAPASKLGDMEHRILSAIDALGAKAYGANVGTFLSEAEGRNFPLSQIYSTLSRLEMKGFVESAKANDAAGRRIPYVMTASGRRALLASQIGHAETALFPFGRLA